MPWIATSSWFPTSGQVSRLISLPQQLTILCDAWDWGHTCKCRQIYWLIYRMSVFSQNLALCVMQCNACAVRLCIARIQLAKSHLCLSIPQNDLVRIVCALICFNLQIVMLVLLHVMLRVVHLKNAAVCIYSKLHVEQFSHYFLTQDMKIYFFFVLIHI